jgi:DNA replication protein DnaC
MSSPVQQPACPLCGGSGWKEIAQTGAAGRAVKAVSKCDCVVAARADKLLAAARIPARYQHCEFSNFDTHFEGKDHSLSAALLAAQKFVEEYPLEKSGLLLTGSIGVGKTHLAVSAIRALIAQKGVPCLFYDYRELLKQIQNSYNASVQITEMDVLRPVFDAEVLVLDELGAVKPTEWVWDTVSHILNTRYNDERTTVITTNFDDQPAAAVAGPRGAARQETLGDRIGERMRSRLHEMCRTVEMRGEDFRTRFKSANFR